MRRRKPEPVKAGELRAAGLSKVRYFPRSAGDPRHDWAALGAKLRAGDSATFNDNNGQPVTLTPAPAAPSMGRGQGDGDITAST